MDYFTNMFKNIDKNIVLDEEQINIIKNTDDNLMVIAGAGSGKTTTISAKVNYLIQKLGYQDEEILVISFTNKAVQELETRINKDFHHNITVQTFHKLGYQIIKQNQKPQPCIIKNKNEIIKNYIEKNIINNQKELKKFLELFYYYFEIDQTINMFKTYDKYYIYKKRKKYPTLKSQIEYIQKQTKEEVKSPNEQIIANYLFINNINYEYQQPKTKTCTPDFTIQADGKTYYIEYFDFSTHKKFQYEKNINKIRQLYKPGTLIEIYSDFIIETLDIELQKLNIKKNNQNINHIFEETILKNKSEKYIRFIEFSSNIISLIKTKGNKPITQNNQREILFTNYIEKLYEYYQNHLEKTNQIDFDDMINKATQIINNQPINLKYKYIIIDEYQDISNNRFELIKSLRQKLKSKLMVVGDDWQCIYKFTSSNINLFTHFEKYVGECTTLKITKTYRNSKQLIDIAGSFIQNNQYQIKKNLISDKQLDYPITLLKYKSNKIAKKLIEAIEYLSKKYPNKNILILGRYTFDINKIQSNQIIKQENQIIYKNKQDLKIEYMTAHASKGLGYDNVILINAIDDTLGFPSKIKNDPIIEHLQEKDEIKYAEERRLFYVALTRTKNEVIILTPTTKPSIFIKEIKKHKNVKKCHILK